MAKRSKAYYTRGNRGVPAGEDGKHLTDKERRFIESYVAHMDLVRAFDYAGFGGYTGIGKYNKARSILARPEVSKEVQERLLLKHMSKEEVLARLADQARNLAATHIQEDGEVDLQSLLEAGHATLIRKITKSKAGTTIEFLDPQKALELLGKHYRLFIDRIDQTNEVTIQVEYMEPEPSEAASNGSI